MIRAHVRVKKSCRIGMKNQGGYMTRLYVGDEFMVRPLHEPGITTLKKETTIENCPTYAVDCSYVIPIPKFWDTRENDANVCKLKQSQLRSLYEKGILEITSIEQHYNVEKVPDGYIISKKS